MSSALDEVLDNKQAQEFWLRRFIAVFIDALIIFVPITVMVNIAWAVGFTGQVSWLISGGLLLVYTALFESELGYTIGKRVMDLEVVSLDPRPYDIKRALIRNITKVHGIFLIIDLLLGMLAEDKVNMRYMDTVAATEVVDTQVAEWRRAHGLAPPVAGEQEPPVTVQPEGVPPKPTMPPEPEAPAPPPVPPVEGEMEVVEGAPGIAPQPVPPRETPADTGDELAEVPAEPEPAYKMPKEDEGS